MDLFVLNLNPQKNVFIEHKDRHFRAFLKKKLFEI